jgi:hypothetical protein
MNRIVPSLVGALNKSGKGDIAEEFYLELSDDGRKARAFLHSM